MDPEHTRLAQFVYSIVFAGMTGGGSYLKPLSVRRCRSASSRVIPWKAIARTYCRRMDFQYSPCRAHTTLAAARLSLIL